MKNTWAAIETLWLGGGVLVAEGQVGTPRFGGCIYLLEKIVCIKYINKNTVNNEVYGDTARQLGESLDKVLHKILSK